MNCKVGALFSSGSFNLTTPAKAHFAGLKSLACAVGLPLKLNDFKVSLGNAAVRAGPARRHVDP